MSVFDPDLDIEPASVHGNTAFVGGMALMMERNGSECRSLLSGLDDEALLTLLSGLGYGTQR